MVLERAARPDMPDIVADQRAVNQMLLNLLSNAIKFTGRGGCQRQCGLRGRLAPSWKSKDNGIGVDEDDVPPLGEPFFQARPCLRPTNRKAPASVFRLSKGWWNCTAANWNRSRVRKGACVIVRLP